VAAGKRFRSEPTVRLALRETHKSVLWITDLCWQTLTVNPLQG
jgi:hypothetical protein